MTASFKVELHSCWMNGSNELNIELDKLERHIIQVKQKLNVETYQFRSVRFACIPMYLEHFSDLTYLTRLDVFGVNLGSIKLCDLRV